MRRATLRLGALALRVESPRERYVTRLAALLDAPVAGHLRRDAAPLRVRFRERPAAPGPVEVPPDGLVVRRGGDGPEVHTEAVSAALAGSRADPSAIVTVRRPDLPERDLAVHLVVVFAKLLALMGYVRLHAAAVALAGEAAVFVGDKGAGKSTLALALGRAGGTILADDDVLVRRGDGRLLASGCDETIRVTAATERHFFDPPLPGPALDSGGEPKKELRAGDLFPSAPYREVPVAGIFFPRVARGFELTPMSGQRAALALLAATRKSHRFAGPEDFQQYLRLLGALLAGVPAYRLELGADLRDLGPAAERLGREIAAARAR